MNQFKSALGSISGEGQQEGQQGGENKQGGLLGGITDKLNSTARGGQGSEAKEDGLDKGPQDNEPAVEQAKDEQISDFIRGQYKSASGKDNPIPDKS